MRFRNISKIMDCVSCEKCKVWGKLQILGLGTAVKILLSDEKDLDDTNVSTGSSKFLNRQEVIALINTLNQLARSVEFFQCGRFRISRKARNIKFKCYFMRR